MKELDVLYQVMRTIYGESGEEPVGIPLFSFEGLPGAGKTTQIQLVTEALERRYGKGYYIDLPTKSPIGKALRALYAEESRWNEVRKSSPWLNPVFISADLRLALQEAVRTGAKYAVMSRGILSTYYYNLDAYQGEDWEEQWNQMEQHMRAFARPSVIVFMDIGEEAAHTRVVNRNRGPMRKMDQVDEMKKDRAMFQEYLKRLEGIPVHTVDASGTREEVTTKIVGELERYLK